MNVHMYQLSIELTGGELVLSQQQPGGSVSTITLATEQLDALLEVLRRTRQTLWQRQEESSRGSEDGNPGPASVSKEIWDAKP